MNYPNIHHGIFIKRLNRFVAEIRVNGQTERCHVKNTGRLGELLLPGAEVLLTKTDNPNRTTQFDLVSVYKGNQLFNIDSQMPNKLYSEWLKGNCPLYTNLSLLRPETRYKNSRFDFYLEADGKKIFTEVKGVTLLKDGTAYFPDAPTLRGLKHINELIASRKEGYDACIAFILQMKGALRFSPNHQTQPEFAKALRTALKAGVRLLALDCIVKENFIMIDKEIDIVLSDN